MSLHPTTKALPLLATAALVLTGCASIGSPSGPTVTEDHEVDAAVTAVHLEGTGDLSIRTGESSSLTVTARESTHERLVTDVRDGVLVLGIRSGAFLGDVGRIEYELVLPEVDGITVEGTGDVDAVLTPTRSLRVAVDGTGDVRAEGVDVEDLLVEIDGTGGITLLGTAGAQSVRIDGTGGYDGTELESEDAVVVVNGTGGADVHVTGALEAQVDGTGSVTHSGGAEVNASVDGLGDVRER
ncbi:GIN domain-containing protein [Georgenia subflava]|uniref:Putative auto-transporter adhesin head GIN domain-containing protein n=1 Tax=Georgenia subflava TaxID=1622177 RepID=A0A6N7ELN7_9MICO|nr:DUF2807 domain-containing protein [Georgenia subflava]MPV36164.1 hypothetical protein [Georgenia subflava]